MSFREFLEERVSPTKQLFRDLKDIKMHKGVFDDVDQFGKTTRWKIETTLSLKNDVLTYQLKMTAGSKSEIRQVHYVERNGLIYRWYDKVPSLKADIDKGHLVDKSDIRKEITLFQSEMQKSNEPWELFEKKFK